MRCWPVNHRTIPWGNFNTINTDNKCHTTEACERSCKQILHKVKWLITYQTVEMDRIYSWSRLADGNRKFWHPAVSISTLFLKHFHSETSNTNAHSRSIQYHNLIAAKNTLTVLTFYGTRLNARLWQAERAWSRLNVFFFEVSVFWGNRNQIKSR